MKTNEQIESAIISKFANDVLGVSAIKEEHVNNQYFNSIKVRLEHSFSGTEGGCILISIP